MANSMKTKKEKDFLSVDKGISTSNPTFWVTRLLIGYSNNTINEYGVG
jgi:hypothetical protein